MTRAFPEASREQTGVEGDLHQRLQPDLFGSDVKLQIGVNYLPKPYLSHKLTSILAVAFAENGAHLPV